MKVRIKEYIEDRYIRYKVQYKVYGLLWRTYDWHNNIKDAIKDAEKLRSRKIPRYMTIEEAGKEVEQENKEQE